MRHALVPQGRALRGLPGLAIGLILVAGLTVMPTEHAAAEAPGTSITTLKATSTNSQPRLDTKSDSGPLDRRTVGNDRVVAELGEQATEPFSTVGVTWSSDSTGTSPDVQVRTKSASGDWSDWETITDGDPIQAETGRLATDPIYVGDATGIQLRAVGDTTTRLKDVEVALVKSPEAASDANPEALAATAASDLAPRPSIITRKGWGADEKLRCNEDKMGTTIKGVVVHHTAGSNSYSKAQSASIIRDIYAYHTKTLGWCDIGYNFLVDKYGQIFEGRWGGIDMPIHGSHATEWNTNTMGVSFMGNYETASPPAVMLNAGAGLIAWKLDAFQREAKGKVKLAGKVVNIIFGHGDVMATACPGKNIRSKMASLRTDVENRMGARGPIGKAWDKRGGEGTFGHPHVAEKVIGGGRVAGFLRSGNPKSLYWHPYTDDHETKGPIDALYSDLGGPESALGWPRSDVHDVANGRGQGFSHGAIYRSGRTPAREVHGAIYNRYRAIGGPGGLMKLPTTNVKPGAISGSEASKFEGGMILYHKATGAWEITGEIAKRYYKLSDSQESKLGRLTKAEYATSGGRKAVFEKGKIVWNATTGRVAVVFD